MLPHASKRKRAISFATVLITALTLVFSSLSTNASIAHASGGSAYVRVNQVGYVTGQTKSAILMATQAESGATFHVINTSTGKTVYSAPIGANQGSWSTTFPDTYLLDFSAVHNAGSYTINVSGPSKPLHQHSALVRARASTPHYYPTRCSSTKPSATEQTSTPTS